MVIYKNIVLLLFPCLFIGNMLHAQNKDGAIHVPDEFDFPYIKIDETIITGNNLTRERIITRELDFRNGDSLSTFQKGSNLDFREKRFARSDSSELMLMMLYSRENIINTRLFLTVDLSLEQIEGKHYRISIVVTERHYWWLFPVPKLNAPNFNEWLRDPKWSDLSIGLFFSHNNLWGRSHQMSVIGFVGKSYALAMGYYIPWIGYGEKIGMLMAAGYENLFVVEYGSIGNKRQMIYADNGLQSVKTNVSFRLRPGLYNYGTVKMTGEWIKISDSVFRLDSGYLSGRKQSNISLSLYADYYYDSRNSKSYPLKGNLLRVFLEKKGLGIVSKDVDLFYYGIDFHFYQTIARKFYVAEMVKAENQSGQGAPYYYQLNMTGDNNFIRGFDLYTLKGDQMYYFRSNFKYELIRPSLKKVEPGQEKNKFKAIQYAFYLNVFADCGYVVNNFTSGNPYNNRMLFSYGLGLDFVSYYDLVLRFEYAFTSIGTNGFYIAFGMPI